MNNINDIYEDIDIYYKIKQEYEISNNKLIHEIYLIKNQINKIKSFIKKNINKINNFKITFMNNTGEWKLADSCNKNKLKTKVKKIKEIYQIITFLKYENEDYISSIESYNLKIKNLIKQEHNIKKCNENTIQIEDYEELNFIINC